MFNITFNNISATTWLSDLLVKETWVSGKTHRPAASLWQTECCIEYTTPLAGIEMATFSLIYTDCISRCKSNYHTIAATINLKFVPWKFRTSLVLNRHAPRTFSTKIYVELRTIPYHSGKMILVIVDDWSTSNHQTITAEQ